MAFDIRPIAATESEAARALLHAAHAWNLANGFNFTAADISAAELAPRLDPATFFVAVALNAELLGTSELKPAELLGTSELKPEEPKDPWHVPGDWGLHLLAVAPEAVGQGVGRALVDHAEALAVAAGSPRLVLDTPANHPWLPDFYRRLGYRDIATYRWDGKLYVSAILAKRL